MDAGICSSHTTLDFSDAGGAGITIADFEPLFATGADRNLGPVLLAAPGFYPVLCNRLSSQVRRPGSHAVSEDDCYFTSRSTTSIIEIVTFMQRTMLRLKPPFEYLSLIAADLCKLALKNVLCQALQTSVGAFGKGEASNNKNNLPFQDFARF